MTRSSYRIMFVCLGNICRSPAGENIMRQVISDANLSSQITCHSAGTANYHTGKSPDKRMTATLNARNYTVTGAAQQFTTAHFEKNDLILAMDKENLRNIKKLDPHNRYAEKIRLFTDFSQKCSHKEVPDPYYDGQEGFEEVADIIEDAAPNILEHIQTTWEN